MALATMTLDPGAAAYTDNQIVGKINTATDSITRASSVSAAARPIATSEVTDTMINAGAIKTKLGAEADGNKLVSASLAAAAGVTNAQMATGHAKASLDAMSDTTRGYLKTSPTTGMYPIVSAQRTSTGTLQITYNDVPV